MIERKRIAQVVQLLLSHYLIRLELRRVAICMYSVLRVPTVNLEQMYRQKTVV